MFPLQEKSHSAFTPQEAEEFWHISPNPGEPAGRVPDIEIHRPFAVTEDFHGESTELSVGNVVQAIPAVFDVTLNYISSGHARLELIAHSRQSDYCEETSRNIRPEEIDERDENMRLSGEIPLGWIKMQCNSAGFENASDLGEAFGFVPGVFQHTGTCHDIKSIVGVRKPIWALDHGEPSVTRLDDVAAIGVMAVCGEELDQLSPAASEIQDGRRTVSPEMSNGLQQKFVGGVHRVNKETKNGSLAKGRGRER